MSSEDSPLEAALQRGLAEGGSLAGELYALGEHPVTTLADARAVCLALQTYLAQLSEPGTECGCEDLHPLASLLQDVESDDAFAVIEAHGLPTLVQIFDQLLTQATDDDAEDLLFLLKIFVMYGHRPGMERILAAIDKPLDLENYVWGLIFEAVTEDHPQRHWLLDMLRNRLPSGFAGVSYLDFVNRLADEEGIESHPFDSDAGMQQLRQWASSENPDEYSYAQSVALALPMLKHAGRDELLRELLEHEDDSVRVDAGWAAGKLGWQAGIDELARLCTEPAVAYFAREHLQDLNRADAIPEDARDPGFIALTELCAWLALPEAYGEAPDELEIFDSRTAFWPPTNDTRPLFLIRYVFHQDLDDPTDEGETGIGMVGGAHSGCLFGEVDDQLSAEDLYALHCCWEMELNNDPRAPEVRNVEAGRVLLGW